VYLEQLLVIDCGVICKFADALLKTPAHIETGFSSCIPNVSFSFLYVSQASHLGYDIGKEGKGKVVPVLICAQHHDDVLLTPALDGGEWSASRPGRFTPRERALGTH
jgi:hypothetical protein